jgi:acyl carrier protein
MEQLIEILSTVKPGVDFNTEEHLIDKRILDSLSIIRLVGELSDAFDVEFTPLDIVPDNFQSAAAIWALIQRLQED